VGPPGGPLGAFIFQATPTLTLNVTGKVDIRASVTFACYAEYRWNQGNKYTLAYCTHSAQPLQLSADSGVDATASLALGANLTLDDVIGVDGSITGSVHAGYRPTRHPVTEVDGQVKYDLNACLACFWRDSPALRSPGRVLGGHRGARHLIRDTRIRSLRDAPRR
jgi:hypothetical protein